MLSKKEKSKLVREMKKEFPKSNSEYKLLNTGWSELLFFYFIIVSIVTMFGFAILSSIYNFNDIWFILAMVIATVISVLGVNITLGSLYNNNIKYLTSIKYSEVLVPLNIEINSMIDSYSELGIKLNFYLRDVNIKLPSYLANELLFNVNNNKKYNLLMIELKNLNEDDFSKEDYNRINHELNKKSRNIIISELKLIIDKVDFDKVKVTSKHGTVLTKNQILKAINSDNPYNSLKNLSKINTYKEKKQLKNKEMLDRRLREIVE